jgi:hypothetical protein
MRSRFAFLWVLVTAIIAGIAAYIAYGAGVATHITGTAADGAVYYHPFFPFFGFGFFFPILLIVLLILAFRPRRWGRGGWGGGYGMKGAFPHGGVPPQIEQRLQEWHRAAHGEAVTPPTADAPAGGEQTRV